MCGLLAKCSHPRPLCRNIFQTPSFSFTLLVLEGRVILGSRACMSQDSGHNLTVTFIYCNLIMHWRKASWCRTCSGRQGVLSVFLFRKTGECFSDVCVLSAQNSIVFFPVKPPEATLRCQKLCRSLIAS